MNGKIMLLVPDRMGEALCGWAEELIGEISLSFGSSITLVRERIGQRSRESWGAALTEETVEACRQCGGVFCGGADADGLNDLCLSLELPLRVRRFPAYEGRSPVTLCRVTDTEPELLAHAVMQAFSLALEEGKPLMYVSPAGKKAGADFSNAVRVCAERTPHVFCQALSPEEMLAAVISHPEKLGVLLLPPYLARLAETAAREMSPVPALAGEYAKNSDIGVFAPVVPENAALAGQVSPVGTVKCVSRLLRETLKMENEADCLDTALNNVLRSGWHTLDMPGETPSVTAEAMLKLILEQVELAGSFMNKSRALFGH